MRGAATVTEPEENREKTPKTDAVLHPPTANPARTRVPPEGPGRARDDAGPEPEERDEESGRGDEPGPDPSPAPSGEEP